MRSELPTHDESHGARITRAEALARRLQTEIAEELMRPGERIGTKEELRQRFGVAVATVNEAVRMMEARGLVAARPGPGGGVFVAKTSARARLVQMMLGLDDGSPTLRDCVELRNALEPLICSQAAEAPRARDVQDLYRLVDAMEATTEDGRAYLRINWALHRRIGRMARNAPLRALYATLIDVLDDGLDDFDFGRPGLERVALHRELVDAIAHGPPERLDAVVAAHRDGSPLPS